MIFGRFNTIHSLFSPFCQLLSCKLLDVYFKVENLYEAQKLWVRFLDSRIHTGEIFAFSADEVDSALEILHTQPNDAPTK